jgi:hypothetical protein
MPVQRGKLPVKQMFGNHSPSRAFAFQHEVRKTEEERKV